MLSIEAVLFEPVGCLAEFPDGGIYEDVAPVLRELRSMGVRLIIATSLSRAAAKDFINRFGLVDFFEAVWTRDDGTPLHEAVSHAALAPEKMIFLTDTADGIRAAREAGVHPILMMNDPDDARRLAMQNPAGGVVSLHEIPDLIRLLIARNESRVR